MYVLAVSFGARLYLHSNKSLFILTVMIIWYSRCKADEQGCCDDARETTSCCRKDPLGLCLTSSAPCKFLKVAARNCKIISHLSFTS